MTPGTRGLKNQGQGEGKRRRGKENERDGKRGRAGAEGEPWTLGHGGRTAGLRPRKAEEGSQEGPWGRKAGKEAELRWTLRVAS